MMKRKMLLTAVLIIIPLLVTGCWSRRELNDLAIASAIGIDKEDHQYKVSVQIVVPSEVASSKGGGGGYETPVTVYTAKAKTVSEAIRKMTTVTPRKVYLSQLRVVVIGEELAREGIAPMLDFLVRDHEVREEDTFTIISKGARAEDTLNILTRLEKIPALKMYGSMKTMDKYWAPTTAVKLGEVYYDLITPDRQTAIPGIEIIGDKEKGKTKNVVASVSPSTYMKFNGTAVFHKDKLVGWLNEAESKGFNYITNHVKKTADHLACPHGGTLAIDIIRTRTDIIGHIEKGKPAIEVVVGMEGNIADVECDIDLTDPQTVQDLQRIGDETLQGVIKTALNKIQHDYKTDTFGFGEAIHRADPRVWRKLREDWEELFPSVPVKIVTDFKIRNLGTTGNPVQKGPEE